MAWLIAALGTGLAIAGTVSIYFGAPYIQVEWGYSEVIAGTTALSAGIVTIALAAILFAIRDLGRVTAAATPSVPVVPRAERQEIVRDGEASAVPTPATRIEPIARSGEAAALRPAAESKDDGREVGEPALFRPTHQEPPATDQAPTVVGRYEANGASYVLFSDGTIEVESETGTHRYASMQALRDHIERQEEAG